MDSSNFENHQNGLDDILLPRKEPRNGSPVEIMMLLYELAQSPDPVIQLFLVFFAVTIGVPFFGGLIILFLDYTKEDKNGRPKRAFSWIPFVGSLTEMFWSPLAFLEKQFKWFGYIFTIDTIVRESTCLYGSEGFQEFVNPSGPLGKSKKNKLGQLTFLGNQMGSIFDPAYKANMDLFTKAASELFPKLGLEENYSSIQDFLEEKLGSLISDSTTKNRKPFDLFAICSCLYLHMMLYITLGEEFARSYSDDLVDELHQTQMNMNFTFVRFIGSFGLPTGASQHTNKVSKKIKKLIKDEIENRSELSDQKNEELNRDYLALLLAKKLPGLANEYIWSHIAHLILSCHAIFVSNLGWSFYHIRKMKNSSAASKFVNETFINSCILETARRYAPAMISKAIHDDVLFKNNCKLQPGSTVFICPASIQLDEKNFKNPLDWDHQRWSINSCPTIKPFDPSYGLIISNSLDTLLKMVLKLMIYSKTEILLDNPELPHPKINYWATLTAPWPRRPILVTLHNKSEEKEE